MLLKAMPGGDVGAHSDLFVPSQWLSETIPRKTPYFPQIGDVLMYFKSGHQKYIELVELRNSYKVNIDLYDTFGHGVRTPNEGINQRNLKISADVADEICFGRS